MAFEWDESKSERNWIKLGSAFRVAIELFEGFVLEEEDLRRNYGERRMIATELDAVARALESYGARWHKAAEQPTAAE